MTEQKTRPSRTERVHAVLMQHCQWHFSHVLSDSERLQALEKEMKQQLMWGVHANLVSIQRAIQAQNGRVGAWFFQLQPSAKNVSTVCEFHDQAQIYPEKRPLPETPEWKEQGPLDQARIVFRETVLKRRMESHNPKTEALFCFAARSHDPETGQATSQGLLALVAGDALLKALADDAPLQQETDVFAVSDHSTEARLATEADMMTERIQDQVDACRLASLSDKKRKKAKR
jgi:hypothetical protein